MVDPSGGGAEIIRLEGENGEVLTAEIVDADRAVLPVGSATSTRFPQIAADRIFQAAPDVARALRGGKIMRLISEPAGALTQAKQGGVYGSVHDGRGFLQNLVFEGGPANVRIVAAPAAAFQIASAVTLQYYLNTITSQLEALQHGLSDIKAKLNREERAELEAAEASCADIGCHVEQGIRLRTDDQVKLDDAHKVARLRFAAARDGLLALEDLIREAINDDGTIRDGDKFERALESAATDGVHNYQVMLLAASVMFRVLALRAVRDADSDPRRVASTQSAAVAEIEKVRNELRQLGDLLTRLNIRRRVMEDAYGIGLKKQGLNAPTTEHERFRRATKVLRSHLRKPVEQWLPALDSGGSWVMEIRNDPNGEIEARMLPLHAAGRTGERSGS
jgi:hypothetical protein